ncbi:MAG: diacylglycerol kinase [Acidihalobacter sp.]|jgi:diacylglycerol kinase
MRKYKNRPLTHKLRFALAGWRHAWRGEDNFRRLVWLGLAAVAFFIALRPTALWWALIALCIGLMWTLELVNTAVEELVDLLSPEQRVEAGRIKDLMAGAVLSLGLATAVVGACALWTVLARG